MWGVAVTCPPGHGEVLSLHDCVALATLSGKWRWGTGKKQECGVWRSYRHCWLQVAHTRLVLQDLYACLVDRKMGVKTETTLPGSMLWMTCVRGAGF